MPGATQAYHSWKSAVHCLKNLAWFCLIRCSHLHTHTQTYIHTYMHIRIILQYYCIDTTIRLSIDTYSCIRKTPRYNKHTMSKLYMQVVKVTLHRLIVPSYTIKWLTWQHIEEGNILCHSLRGAHWEARQQREREREGGGATNKCTPVKTHLKRLRIKGL